MTCQPVARGSTSVLRNARSRFCWYGARCRQNGTAMTPINTFPSITASPSHTYGRHQSRRAKRTTIHAPQAMVEKESTRPITGEASKSRRDGLVPAPYSMAKRTATKTRAPPPFREPAGQPQDHRELRQLRRLTQPVAPDGDPRLLARRRPRPPANDERQHQKEYRRRVSDRRRPLEQAGRHAK